MKQLWIATPLYGHLTTQHVSSLVSTAQLLQHNDIHVTHCVNEGCCYLDQSRNHIVHAFLQSNVEELVFVDADISWDAQEFLNFIRRPQEFIGAVAPFRHGTYGFPGNTIGPQTQEGLFPADRVPTTMLKLKRSVFEKLDAAGKAPLRVDRVWGTMNERSRYKKFFCFEEDDANNVTYGEDIAFCRKWLDVGGKMWIEPYMTLAHWGKNNRKGSFAQYMADRYDVA